MDFESFKMDDLRKVIRHFCPETQGTGNLAHIGTKGQIISYLQTKGVMPCEALEFLAGNAKAAAPTETPVIPVAGAAQIAPATAEAETIEKTEEPKMQNLNSVTAAAPAEMSELDLVRSILMKGQKPAGVDEEAVNSIITARMTDYTVKTMDAFKSLMNETAAELKKKLVKVIEIKQPDGAPNKVIGTCHCKTEQIAQVAALGIHQMLVGPAGSGKTTCCEKVAEILNLKFYPMSVGPQTTKSDLLGFTDAAGNYHSTPLRDAFATGGLLLLDEVDAANAGVLTIINALLANGYCSFPDGIIKKHEKFTCICACNTYGRGADRQYVGRNQLDAATLDRFAVVDFDYDEKLEYMLAGPQFEEWVTKVQTYRHRADDLKLRVVISPRASINGAKLLASSMKESTVEELVIWKGIPAETRSKIQAI